MSRLVQEFSPACLSDSARILATAKIVAEASAQGQEVAVVASTIPGVGENLYNLASECADQAHGREVIQLMAGAEQISSALLTLAIEKMGCPARSITRQEIAPNNSNNRDPLDLKLDHIESCFMRGEVPVITAMAASPEKSLACERNSVTDTTAVALAYQIGADRLDCYSDGGGIFTADPALVPKARKLDSLSYEEMLELASVGSQAMSLKSLQLALDTHVPLRLRSSEKPGDDGTLITHRLVAPAYTISSIALDPKQAAITIGADGDNEKIKKMDGLVCVFDRLHELSIQTEMVMMLAHEDKPGQEIRFTVREESLEKVVSLIESNKHLLGECHLHVEQDLAMVALVGSRLKERKDIIASVFAAINQAQIPIRMVASSDLRVSLLVPSEFGPQTVRLIHNRLSSILHQNLPLE